LGAGTGSDFLTPWNRPEPCSPHPSPWGEGEPLAALRPNRGVQAGMANPSRASGSLSAPGSRGTGGRTTPATSVRWFWPNPRTRGWKSEGRSPKSDPLPRRDSAAKGNPKTEARSVLGRVGRCRVDAQGSNTGYTPEYHRRNTVRARGTQALLGRLGRCGGFGRWGKSAVADIGVSVGAALNGDRRATRVKGPTAEFLGSSISAAPPGGEERIWW
jgi:hypothetical protein